MDIIARLGDFAWNPAVILCFLGAGIYCSARTRFYQLRPKLWLREILHGAHRDSKDSLSPWKAAVTAIGGALGTGNISGVAWGIALGGPGAVFWMWMSALFGMALSFTEKTLTLLTVRRGRGNPLGGAMCYIEKALGKAPAFLYSAVSVIAIITSGSMTQCSAITGSFCALTGADELVVGLFLGFLTYLVISGGLKRTAAVSALLVPTVSVLYILFGLATIVALRGALPGVLQSIFREAFAFRPAASGTGAVLAMRYGYARGIFSSEAGVGSSTIPHASSNAREPAHQGAWGIFEVCLDTLIICTITALIILCGPFAASTLTGEALTTAAFSVLLGRLAGPFVTLCIFILAFSTLISREWCAEEHLRYLSRGRTMSGGVRIAFCIFSFLGAILPSRALWDSSDVLNVILALPNLIAVCILVPDAAKSLGRLRPFPPSARNGIQHRLADRR